ncbi:MAG: hypothetical protein ACRESE_05805, partial [Gammaproteobacteria bacterium]
KTALQFALSGILLGLVMLGTCVAGSAHADTLTNLRTTLKGLESQAAIKGVLDVRSIVTNGKSDSSKPRSAHLQLDIHAGDGLSVNLSPALLQQISAEQAAHAADPSHAAPTADLLSSIGPMQIEHMASAAPALLRTLEGANSPIIKPTVLEGEPVQELSLNLPLQASKKEKSSVKDFQDKLLLWLNSKGVPQAYQETVHAKFCKFFLCVTVDNIHSGWLQVIDGRLVTVKLTREQKQSGLGQDSDTRTVYNLHLQ